jgi:hypothetical protein
VPRIEPLYESSSENSDSEVMVPATPPKPAGKAQLAGESQGGTTITPALRTPERLRLGPDLIPRASPPWESEPARQLPASTAPPSLGQADVRPIRLGVIWDDSKSGKGSGLASVMREKEALGGSGGWNWWFWQLGWHRFGRQERR